MRVRVSTIPSMSEDQLRLAFSWFREHIHLPDLDESLPRGQMWRSADGETVVSLVPLRPCCDSCDEVKALRLQIGFVDCGLTRFIEFAAKDDGIGLVVAAGMASTRRQSGQPDYSDCNATYKKVAADINRDMTFNNFAMSAEPIAPDLYPFLVKLRMGALVN